MKINLNDKPAERWETVTCPAGEFEVAVRNPTYEEQGRDGMVGSDRSWMINRIETAISDWRGIEDEDGKPIPFHFKSVAALCQKFPSVFNQLLALANDAYRGVPTEAESGNSELPSSESSEDGK